MPYTKEQLLNNSAMSQVLGRQGQKVKGVLSTAEQNELLKQGQGFQVISNNEVFWFTDDYCMTVNILPEFVPSRTTCPVQVTPRSGLPDGWVRTVEDYVKVFEQGERHIQTIEELLEYLNRFE